MKNETLGWILVVLMSLALVGHWASGSRSLMWTALVLTGALLVVCVWDLVLEKPSR